jgi:CDGSH-type Zn-finger protein
VSKVSNLTPEIAAQVVALYKPGVVGVKSLAKQFFIPKETIKRCLETHGITPVKGAFASGLEKLKQHKEAIISAYTDEERTLTTLCAEYKCDPTTLKKFLRHNGIEIRKEWSRTGHKIISFTAEQEADILNQYKQAVSGVAISHKYKVSFSTIKKVLEKNGMELRKAGPVAKPALAKRAKVYGVTQEVIEALKIKQDNKCAICGCGPSDQRNSGGRKNELCIDHDHRVKNAIRGLLCSRCNLALGMFADSVDIIKSAHAYLKFHAEKNNVPL